MNGCSNFACTASRTRRPPTCSAPRPTTSPRRRVTSSGHSGGGAFPRPMPTRCTRRGVLVGQPDAQWRQCTRGHRSGLRAPELAVRAAVRPLQSGVLGSPDIPGDKAPATDGPSEAEAPPGAGAAAAIAEAGDRPRWHSGTGALGIRWFALLQTLFYTAGFMSVMVDLIAVQCYRVVAEPAGERQARLCGAAAVVRHLRGLEPRVAVGAVRRGAGARDAGDLPRRPSGARGVRAESRLREREPRGRRGRCAAASRRQASREGCRKE